MGRAEDASDSKLWSKFLEKTAQVGAGVVGPHGHHGICLVKRHLCYPILSSDEGHLYFLEQHLGMLVGVEILEGRLGFGKKSPGEFQTPFLGGNDGQRGQRC